MMNGNHERSYIIWRAKNVTCKPQKELIKSQYFVLQFFLESFTSTSKHHDLSTSEWSEKVDEQEFFQASDMLHPDSMTNENSSYS